MQLMEEQQLAREAEQSKREAEYAAFLAERRAARAKEKAAQLKERLNGMAPPTKERSVDAWLALTAEAARKATQRERDHLRGFFPSHSWCITDIAQVLTEMGWVEVLFASRPFFEEHFSAVRQLLQSLEHEHFSKMLGLYLHFDLHLPLSKILSTNQAVCKQYDHHPDSYKPKVLLHHKFSKGKQMVPRIAPPGSVMMSLIKSIQKSVCSHAKMGGSHSRLFSAWSRRCFSKTLASWACLRYRRLMVGRSHCAYRGQP